MLSLVVVLLAATPGQPSLLSPLGLEVRPSLRLVAQASPETPPPPLLSAPDARIRELTERIEEIDTRLNTMELGWPSGARTMLIVGAVLTPMILLGLPLAIVGDVDGNLGLTVLGGMMIAASPVGLVMIAVAYIQGSNAERRTRLERNALADELSELEDELRALKSRQSPSTLRGGPRMPQRAVGTVAFSF
jgi:hypothetical protein